eukprot:scpid75146/ scgid28378/ Cytoplasmic phosphatidylinositol transfer protein 1; Retinal degeneration B homolog beta
MVTHKEYRICMPVSVEEYRIGQLYLIAKHCHEQSQAGDGVEVIKNEPCEDETHGKGRYTEKRIHISHRLPTWAKALVSQYLYVEEKAWNYYPFTITEYSCSLVPLFTVRIQTCYENNSGATENALCLAADIVAQREVVHLDIAHDEVDPKKYKKEEDCRLFQSVKTGRGPLTEKDWKDTCDPVMCSYKLVSATCSIFGLGGYLESAALASIKDVLLHGHRQAFCWIDEWIGLSLDDVRAYEQEKQQETNRKTLGESAESPATASGASSQV